jgi:transcriptional regulator with XRE-family HTH domain
MVAPEYQELAAGFGRNVLRLRRHRDLSQEQLAARTDLHRTEIGLLENGRRVPRLDTIIKLAGGVEVEAAQLLKGLSWYAGSAPRPGMFYVDDGSLRAVRQGRG